MNVAAVREVGWEQMSFCAGGRERGNAELVNGSPCEPLVPCVVDIP